MIHCIAKEPYASVHLIEPSQYLKNQTVSYTDVFMAKWEEYKTDDLRRATDLSSNPRDYVIFKKNKNK